MKRPELLSFLEATAAMYSGEELSVVIVVADENGIGVSTNNREDLQDILQTALYTDSTIEPEDLVMTDYDTNVKPS